MSNEFMDFADFMAEMMIKYANEVDFNIEVSETTELNCKEKNKKAIK